MFVSTGQEPIIAQSLVDLGWHRRQFDLRRSVAYTVVARDESLALGCVYVNPSEMHDARVRPWVRRSAWDDGLDPVLESTVREWIAARWPFERVTFEERDS